uniref:ARAD1C44088p n=1 Tax=Blastobotrys adeninivorans TaxID=409370 RepID=A0A060T3Y7_BLAAD
MGYQIDSIYHYVPSLAATIVSMVIFFLLSIWHGYILIRKKVWYFIPFFIGVVFEFLGYAIRIGSRNKPGSIPLYALQMLFVLLAPPMFAASIYMVLGRMLVFYRAQFASIVSVRRMTAIFVTGDVISFLLQCAGGGIEGSGSDLESIGANVVIGGLCVQLLFFGMFVITSIIANRRLINNNWPKNGPYRMQWQGMLNVLYVTSALILVRSIFRVVEYAQGWNGFTMNHEIFMYMLDTLLMFFVVCIFIYWHPVYCIGNKVDIKASTAEMSPQMTELHDQLSAEPADPKTHLDSNV